jgi:hypothetical protein
MDAFNLCKIVQDTFQIDVSVKPPKSWDRLQGPGLTKELIQAIF